MTIATLLSLACTTVLVSTAATAVQAQPTNDRRAKNPLFDAADPHAIVVGNRLYIYPTWSRREQAFFAFESAGDLTRFQPRGPILRFRDVAWIKEPNRDRHFAWAPCIIEKNEKFYFYYSVGDQNVTPSRIGVAVGSSPTGPFKDSGKPLPMDGKKDVFEAIDPMAYTDPKDGKSYLYAGGSNGSTLRVWELNDDMVSFKRRVDVETPTKFTEGAFMHERGGVYYLSYSHGGWRDASYSVHYATAPSPIGPWDYKGAILVSNDKHKGPGHHSFVRNAATDQWFIVYHRWNNRDGDGPFNGGRSVCIDRVEYDADGSIKPIVMTDEGVPVDAFKDEG